MPGRTRAPRKNPLIPVSSASEIPAEQVSPAPILVDSPICGQCWPDGWATLGDGDYASCEHGEWAKTEHLAKVAKGELTINGARRAQGLPKFSFPDGLPPAVIRGITTDGIPVAIELRGDEPALVSLTRIPMAPFPPDPPVSVTARGIETPTVPPASPFAPKAVEIEPEELDTGDDVMFMPSGG